MNKRMKTLLASLMVATMITPMAVFATDAQPATNNQPAPAVNNQPATTTTDAGTQTAPVAQEEKVVTVKFVDEQGKEIQLAKQLKKSEVLNHLKVTGYQFKEQQVVSELEIKLVFKKVAQVYIKHTDKDNKVLINDIVVDKEGKDPTKISGYTFVERKAYKHGDDEFVTYVYEKDTFVVIGFFLEDGTRIKEEILRREDLKEVEHLDGYVYLRKKEEESFAGHKRYAYIYKKAETTKKNEPKKDNVPDTSAVKAKEVCVFYKG